MQKSVAIIGAGLGGLFAGAILSREGLKVTVIEKNAIIGGGLQSFRRFGTVFDTGMHVIGGLHKGGNILRLCRYLGINDQLHITHADPQCNARLYFAEDQCYYDIPEGRESFIESLSERFPSERAGLEAYVTSIFDLVEQMPLFHLRPQHNNLFAYPSELLLSVNEFIANYISDPKLQSILAYMSPLYSGIKDTTPAYVHAVISVLYIQGASFFVGGSVRLAETLAEVIRSYGGEVCSGDGVVSIDSLKNSITALKTKSGRYIVADYYISAIHPCALIDLLTDKSLLPKAYRTRLEQIPNTYSAFTVNIKLKPQTFKQLTHAGYYLSRYERIWSFDQPQGDSWPNGFLYITPPEDEQGLYASKVILTAPMLWSEVSEWSDSNSGSRPQAYNAWKIARAERLISKMEEIYPDFRDCIDQVNTASPLTIRDYYGAREGGMAGFARDCNHMILSQVPVVTKASNLFLTGQYNNLHGFCGVPLSAITTAEAILGPNVVINHINATDTE